MTDLTLAQLSNLSVYSAMVVGGALACDDESLEARFFHADEIPWDELAFQSTREALTAFLRRG